MAEITIGVKKQEIGTLDMVVKETVKAIGEGKERIFAIAENARSEHQWVQKGYDEVADRLAAAVREISVLERQVKRAREQLSIVSEDFTKHTEDDIKKAFEKVKELQLKHTLLKERTVKLSGQRDEIEQRLAGMQETVVQAENMVSQMGVVMDFIEGNLQDFNVKIGGIHQRQQLGLQVIKAQEEERKRVAREIHDGPAQSMANVVLRMEFCEKLLDVDPEKVRQELIDLKGVVRGNLQDVRKIIFDLRPMALDDLGLVPALKRFLEDYREKYDVAVETVFRGTEKRLASALEVALFRLIQEALNNVRKHAAASKVEITLDIKPKLINAVVKDNGRGFDLKQVLAVNSAGSFGLISMKERVILLGGRLEIKTAPGQGTEVLFRIPVTRLEG